MSDEPEVVFSVVTYDDACHLIVEQTADYQRVIGESSVWPYASFIASRLNAAAAAGGGSTEDQAALDKEAADPVEMTGILVACARCGKFAPSHPGSGHPFEPRREEESTLRQ